MVELLPALLALGLVAAKPPVAAEAEPEVEQAPTEQVEVAEPATDEEVSRPGVLHYSFVPGTLTPVASGLTRVTARTQLSTPTWGYFPLMVSIDNSLGPNQTLQLSYLSTSSGRTYSRAVEVRAGERRSASLPVPSASRYGQLRVRGPGVTEQQGAQVYFNVISRPQVAVFHIGSAPAFERLAGVRPAYSAGTVQVVNVEPSAAPDELAGYVGLDAVVVTGGFLELSEAQRRALEAYAALGGHLVLGQSPRGLEAALPLLGKSPALASLYGLGEVSFCDGCGGATMINVLHAADPPVKPSADNARRRRSWDESANSGANLLLPIARAPVGRFLVIIALFTLAIGPGSLWVARRKGSATLLVTIPGTALVTCLLIVGYSAVRDGFTVHSSVKGFTLLDSAHHRALTASVAGFYANLSPTGARLPPDALVISPLAESYGSSQQGASIVWAEGARFGADFIPSRSYAEWGLLSSQPTRARLAVKADGTQVRVQNALGAHLHSVQLMVNDRVYFAGEVDDGQEKVATPRAEANLTDPEFAVRAGLRLNALVDGPLKEGQFVAVLEGPGFTQLGGLTLSHEKSVHLVRGELER